MPQLFPVAPAVLHRPALLRATRRAALLAVAGLALASSPALAEGTTGPTGATGGGAEAGAAAPAPVAVAPAAPLSRAMIRSVQKKLHLKPDGALGPKTRAAIRRFQKRHKLPVDGRLQPATLAALNVTGRGARVVPAVPAPTGATAQLLAAIAQCESAGDPTKVSASGEYRGKYQFDMDTWASAGGSGDPALAPEAEQDQRAAALYAAEGVKPWPVCGKQAQDAQAASAAPAS